MIDICENNNIKSDMATAWGLTCVFIGLNILEICGAHPMEQVFSGSEGPSGQIMGALVAVMVSVCAVVVLIACVCCKRRSGFKVFRNSPVSASVINETSLSGEDPGHVNPIANAEFTIFTPLSPPHHNNNVFRSQSPVICYTTENETAPEINKAINSQIDGIDVSEWFSASECDFPRSRLKYIRELGPGWFGRVVQGEALTQGSAPTPVAVRILESSASAHEQALFLHEAKFYRLGAHQNILRLLGRSLEATPFLLIQEFCPKGDLKKFLIENREFKESEVMYGVPLRYCCQLASAVEFLHERNVPHLDLAARSCQISLDLTLKLGDYGLLVHHYPNDYYQGTPSIPVRWWAPESVNHTNTTLQPKQITLEANIWSLAVTFWEICEFGRVPYEWLTDDEVISKVMAQNVRLPQPELNSHFVPPLYRLMEYCWLPSSDRPQINQICSMLAHLSKTYSLSPSNTEKTNFSTENFDSRWESLKPNTIIKTDNKSASLTNLHGSFENLDTTMESWLENVASNTNDMQYVRGLSQAIHELDTALASEQTSSSSSFEPTPFSSLGTSKSETILFYDESNSKLQKKTESGSETEDETWRKRIERGALTEKVKQKSKSVADLMVLTHIDMNEVRDIFQEELKKLQEERRESLLFVPDAKTEFIQSLRESQTSQNNLLESSKLTKTDNFNKPLQQESKIIINQNISTIKTEDFNNETLPVKILETQPISDKISKENENADLRNIAQCKVDEIMITPNNNQNISTIIETDFNNETLPAKISGKTVPISDKILEESENTDLRNIAQSKIDEIISEAILITQKSELLANNMLIKNSQLNKKEELINVTQNEVKKVTENFLLNETNSSSQVIELGGLPELVKNEEINKILPKIKQISAENDEKIIKIDVERPEIAKTVEKVANLPITTNDAIKQTIETSTQNNSNNEITMEEILANKTVETNKILPKELLNQISTENDEKINKTVNKMDVERPEVTKIIEKVEELSITTNRSNQVLELEKLPELVQNEEIFANKTAEMNKILSEELLNQISTENVKKINKTIDIERPEVTKTIEKVEELSITTNDAIKQTINTSTMQNEDKNNSNNEITIFKPEMEENIVNLNKKELDNRIERPEVTETVEKVEELPITTSDAIKQTIKPEMEQNTVNFDKKELDNKSEEELIQINKEAIDNFEFTDPITVMPDLIEPTIQEPNILINFDDTTIKTDDLSLIQDFINNERNNNQEITVSPKNPSEIEPNPENIQDLIDISNVQQVNQVFNVFNVTLECFSPNNYYKPFKQSEIESKFVNGINSEVSNKIIDILSEKEPRKLAEIALNSLKENKIINGHDLNYERPKKLADMVLLDSLKTSISEDSGFASVHSDEKLINDSKEFKASADSLDDILSNSEENLDENYDLVELKATNDSKNFKTDLLGVSADSLEDILSNTEENFAEKFDKNYDLVEEPKSGSLQTELKVAKGFEEAKKDLLQASTRNLEDISNSKEFEENCDLIEEPKVSSVESELKAINDPKNSEKAKKSILKASTDNLEAILLNSEQVFVEKFEESCDLAEEPKVSSLLSELKAINVPKTSKETNKNLLEASTDNLKDILSSFRETFAEKFEENCDLVEPKIKCIQSELKVVESSEKANKDLLEASVNNLEDISSISEEVLPEKFEENCDLVEPKIKCIQSEIKVVKSSEKSNKDLLEASVNNLEDILLNSEEILADKFEENCDLAESKIESVQSELKVVKGSEKANKDLLEASVNNLEDISSISEEVLPEKFEENCDLVEEPKIESLQSESKAINALKTSEESNKNLLEASTDSLEDNLSNSKENFTEKFEETCDLVQEPKTTTLQFESQAINDSKNLLEASTDSLEDISSNSKQNLAENIVLEASTDILSNSKQNLAENIVLENLNSVSSIETSESVKKVSEFDLNTVFIQNEASVNLPDIILGSESAINSESLPCISPTSESTENISDKTVIELKISENKPDVDCQSACFVSETSVILGPCEEYGLGLYSGLKTTFGKFSDDDRPEEELLQFSSNFMPYEAENSVDYSLETWDKFLGKSLQEQDTDSSVFDNFSPREDSLDIFKEKATELNENFSSLDTKELSSDQSETSGSNWEPGIGWFLHPQTSPEELSGQIDISGCENIDNSYVGFALDEECVNALRNELAAKLPHAQGLSHEEPQEPEDWDSEERSEIVVKYNVYATPLSPIPEESCCDDVYCDQIQHRDGSDSESEWSEPCLAQTSQLEDLLVIDTETHTAQILESPNLRDPQHRHTPSQDSCCSNDTLFNLEDLNYALNPEQDSDNIIEIEITEDTPKHTPEKLSKTEKFDSNNSNFAPLLSPEDTPKKSPKTEKLTLKLDSNNSNIAPLPSPEDIPWRQLPASLLTYNDVTQAPEAEKITEDTPEKNQEDTPEKNSEEHTKTLKNTEDNPEKNQEKLLSKNSNFAPLLSPEVPPENSSKTEKLTLNLDLNNSNFAPLPSPEDIPWRQLPASLLTYSDVTQSATEPEVEEIASESDLYSNLTDIRFSGPCDAQLMSTSFSESAEFPEEKDWDSGSDTRSSSSGEFIWKEGEHEESLRALHAASHDVSQASEINPMDVIEEENSNSSDSSDCEEEIEETEFVPSAWDAQATPTKSALRSPEKSNKRKNQQKGVWFKKQKYHCVYEYPREPESPVANPTDLWRPLADFSSFADWELDPESCVAPSFEDSTDGYDVLDKFITRNNYPLSRNRDLYQLNPFPDFSAGFSSSDEDFFISSSARPFQPVASSQFFPGSKSKFLSQEGITPDSGIDDVTPDTADNLLPKNIKVPSLKHLAAIAANKTKNEQKNIDSTLGGLRHTRNRLKLDLPPSPNSFTSSRTFSIDLPTDVLNREIPTFTTFGKTRFSVQHVTTPTEEKNILKNVSFEALPHKPIYILDKNEENKNNKPVEMVQGEASLLDSADEDSGIESSANATLERQIPN